MNDGVQAFQMLLNGEPEVWEVVWLTMRVSGLATLLSVVFGIPIGFSLAVHHFPGKKSVVRLMNAGMGLPPVVVGLLVSLLLWRYGPLGDLGLMYSPSAMVLAQAIIATPIVAGFSFAALGSLNPKLRHQLLALGATSAQANWLLLKEARLGLTAAVMAGFGRVVSEVGASMMVGGNIKGQTRVLTTATVMEVGKGNYELALAFGAILLLLAYCIVALLTYLQNHEKREMI